MKRKILITGAAGRIGSDLTQRYADIYDLVLTDIQEPKDARGFPFTQADITDLDALEALCQGVDTVVHLAADHRTTAPWESLLPNNVIGLYNVFEAAHRAGCRRVIFASSVNAVNGLPRDVQMKTSEPVRPGNLYGASKCWGEAVACFYADQKNLSAICLRFGWVAHPAQTEIINLDNRSLDIVLTYADLAHLVQCSIEAPDDLRFGIYHGVSNNKWKRLDISNARAEIGYDPQDDAFAMAAQDQED